MFIAYWMAPCISVDRKMQNMENMGFYRNMHTFEKVIAVSKTSHIVTNRFQLNIERLERVHPKALNASDR